MSLFLTLNLAWIGIKYFWKKRDPPLITSGNDTLSASLLPHKKRTNLCSVLMNSDLERFAPLIKTSCKSCGFFFVFQPRFIRVADCRVKRQQWNSHQTTIIPGEVSKSECRSPPGTASLLCTWCMLHKVLQRSPSLASAQKVTSFVENIPATNNWSETMFHVLWLKQVPRQQ